MKGDDMHRNIRREFKAWEVWDERYHTVVHGSFTYLRIDRPTRDHLRPYGYACLAVGTDWNDAGTCQLIITDTGLRLYPDQIQELSPVCSLPADLALGSEKDQGGVK